RPRSDSKNRALRVVLSQLRSSCYTAPSAADAAVVVFSNQGRADLREPFREAAMGTRGLAGAFLIGLLVSATQAAAPPDASLGRHAHEVLKKHWSRCHGQDGTVEGGMSYILDRERLVQRGKVKPGDAATSPLYQRVSKGKMPPPGEMPRPAPSDLDILKRW